MRIMSQLQSMCFTAIMGKNHLFWTTFAFFNLNSLPSIVIVIVNARFLQRPKKRSRGNQLIHRRLNQIKSIGSGSRFRESGGHTPYSQTAMVFRVNVTIQDWICVYPSISFTFADKMLKIKLKVKGYTWKEYVDYNHIQSFGPYILHFVGGIKFLSSGMDFVLTIFSRMKSRFAVDAGLDACFQVSLRIANIFCSLSLLTDFHRFHLHLI